jgi:hypothetical protein
MEDDPNGRRPPMEDDLQWKTTSNGRQSPMEDNLKILNVEQAWAELCQAQVKLRLSILAVFHYLEC